MSFVNLPVILSLALLCSEPTDSKAVARRHLSLGVDGAVLLVPESYQPRAGEAIDLLMHLHGASEVVERLAVASGWPGVLVTFNRKGLSRVYAEPFSDPKLFQSLVEATRVALKEFCKGMGEPRIGRLVVSSFSAGFGGVREMLKNPATFGRIDGLIMLDSIYCGYRGAIASHEPDPELMDGFRRFAIEAAAGRKAFLLSHSAQVPGSYASTTETADFLIKAVGGQSRLRSVDWSEDWRQIRETSVGQFMVLGFAGADGAAHMKHLRHADLLWKYYERNAAGK